MIRTIRTTCLLAIFVAIFSVGSWSNTVLAEQPEGIAGQVAPVVLPADLSGSWEGSWKSCTTGHKGPLKAEFCRLGNGDYRVNFRGRFFKLFPFRYSVVLQVVEESDVVQLSGSSYLGRMFGTFCYSATADACQFRADYTSRKDSGIFLMKRVCP